jgi:hypothetical protein
MKPIFKLKNFSYLFITLTLLSCESHEQKADEAFEKVKAEKSMPMDTVFIEKEFIAEPKKAKEMVKNEVQDEWLKFKTETEKKIIVNEILIKQIKNTPNLSVKLIRKLLRLEKDNDDIRNQMEEYQIKLKEVWSDFKLKTIANVANIDAELKDLRVK